MRAERVMYSAIGVFLLAVAVAVPAAAQTPAAPVAKAPAAQAPAPAAAASAKRGEVGILGGLSSVQNVGGMFGAQIAYRANPHIHLVAETVWMQDAVTRARLNSATNVATYLATAQGKSATGTLTAPSYYTGAGFRFVIPTQGSVQPYFAAGGGMAKVVSQPVFTLAGSDVTTQLANYGLTLGSDISGDVTKFAFSGGLGLLIDRSNLSFDLGLRVTSIRTEGQATNVLRGQVGISYRF